MAIYSLALRGTVGTSGSPTADVATPTAAGVRPRIVEASVFLGAATASLFGLARTTALGTRTTPTALLPQEPGDPALAGIRLVDMAIAWSAAATIVANDLRRIGLPAAIGNGMIWNFPTGLVIAQQLSLVIVNRAANSIANDVTFVADV